MTDEERWTDYNTIWPIKLSEPARDCFLRHLREVREEEAATNLNAALASIRVSVESAIDAENEACAMLAHEVYVRNEGRRSVNVPFAEIAREIRDAIRARRKPAEPRGPFGPDCKCWKWTYNFQDWRRDGLLQPRSDAAFCEVCGRPRVKT